MTKQRISVEVEGDFIERQSKASPAKALSELIWNSLDGDATSVSVDLVERDLSNGLSKIVVKDNGTGFSRSDAENYFRLLGGSWKRQTSKTHNLHRKVHGREGRGRYKALALGKIATWEVCFETADKERYRYEIEMSASDYGSFLISEATSSDSETGVTLTIEELLPKSTSLTSIGTVQNLTEVFAPYLISYKDIQIEIGENVLNPNSIVEDEATFSLRPIVDDDEQVYLIDLQVIEWKTQTPSSRYLCDTEGFPFHQTAYSSNIRDYFFSA